MTAELDLHVLENKGYRLVDIIAGDLGTTEETRAVIRKIKAEKRDTFYRGLLHTLTGERFLEPQARELWEGILKHKYVVSERLGRNVGVRVAALDYLENIRKLIHAPRLVPTQVYARTVHMAITDGLTGIYNQRHFWERLEEELSSALKRGEPLAVCMMDLDHFKEYNDTQGHQAGDHLLQKIAAALRAAIRRGDLVARYGGDEFAAILPGTGAEEGPAVTEKIRRAIEDQFSPVGVTISIGMAVSPRDGETARGVVARADELLYRVKEFGGNKVGCLKTVRVTYRQDAPPFPSAVSAVGDFNGWNKSLGKMRSLPESREWTADLLLKPGLYRYKFLLDGKKWIADPLEKNRADDGFGGACSVVTVAF